MLLRYMGYQRGVTLRGLSLPSTLKYAVKSEAFNALENHKGVFFACDRIERIRVDEFEPNAVGLLENHLLLPAIQVSFIQGHSSSCRVGASLGCLKIPNECSRVVE